MIRRLFIVYNPRSSRHEAVEAEVLAPARGLSGWLVAKYEVKATTVEQNVDALAELLGDGDLVIVAGGDGTASIAVNAVMQSEKKVVLAVLGYGNFNDMAIALGARRPVEYGDEYVGGVTEIIEKFERREVREVRPLEVLVNGEHWRYAMCYVTCGMLAESATVFDEKKVRTKLSSGKKGRVFSYWTLAKWYFRNRKKCRLPELSVNGEELPEGATDYVAMNADRMAGVLKGKRWYRDEKKFASATLDLKGLGRLMGFMLRGMRKAPVRETEGDVIELKSEGALAIQVEGEYRRLEGVEKVEVRKGRGLGVIS